MLSHVSARGGRHERLRLTFLHYCSFSIRAACLPAGRPDAQHIRRPALAPVLSCQPLLHPTPLFPQACELPLLRDAVARVSRSRSRWRAALGPDSSRLRPAPPTLWPERVRPLRNAPALRPRGSERFRRGESRVRRLGSESNMLACRFGSWRALLGRSRAWNAECVRWSQNHVRRRGRSHGHGGWVAVHCGWERDQGVMAQLAAGVFRETQNRGSHSSMRFPPRICLMLAIRGGGRGRSLCGCADGQRTCV